MHFSLLVFTYLNTWRSRRTHHLQKILLRSLELQSLLLARIREAIVNKHIIGYNGFTQAWELYMQSAQPTGSAQRSCFLLPVPLWEWKEAAQSSTLSWSLRRTLPGRVGGHNVCWWMSNNPWCVAFVHFPGVHSSTAADFKVSMWCHWRELGLDVRELERASSSTPLEGPEERNSPCKGTEVWKHLVMGGLLSCRGWGRGWKREGNGEACLVWTSESTKRGQEKQVVKGEFGKQFGKRLQKALNLRNCLFYATDSDLSHPGFRGIPGG